MDMDRAAGQWMDLFWVFPAASMQPSCDTAPVRKRPQNSVDIRVLFLKHEQ